MEKETEQKKENINGFYKLLSSMKAVSPIYEKIMKHLVKSLAPEISDDAKKVLYVYFSLLEDGNTRIPLDANKLLDKWNKKWSGLVIQAKLQDKYNELQNIYLEDNNYFNKQIFEKGIKELLEFGQLNSRKDGLPRHLAMARNDSSVNNLVLYIDKEGIKSEIKDNSLFVIDESDGGKYLYANKYYEAKLIIEDRFKKLFMNKSEVETGSPRQRKALFSSSLSLQADNFPTNSRGESVVRNDVIINEISRITNSKIKLNDEQLEAVSRGINENIIVTGGPGTGKTTVVAFILWFLLKNNNEFLNSNIYLTAPSGKAADRVGESLKNTLSLLHPNSDEKKIKEKLLYLESYTIHRLLKYNAGSGKFAYNKEDKFEDKSIFIIDEASMIDISMFANLLQAIPENARVFILGDVDQLPSVDAGAVLGDLLNSSNNVVRLIESKRFEVGSEIAKLKDYIQDRKLGKNTNYEFSFEQYNINKSLWIATSSVKPRNDGGENGISTPLSVACNDDLDEVKTKKEKHKQVRFISLIEDDMLTSQHKALLCSLSQQANSFTINKEASNCGKVDYKSYKNNIEDLLKKWVNKYFFEENESICSLAEKVNPLDESPNDEQKKIRDRLWNMSLFSKILCAEKNSLTGVDKINSFVYYYLKQYLNSKNLWIATTLSEARYGRINNQRYFCGQQLIISKNQAMYRLYNGDVGVVVANDDGIEYLMVKKNEEYLFYPLLIFPIDSIENAFAITIHKSQGSEYNHILMFLPTMVGHRLLTNQILYTGITRAKESVMIVGSQETFDFASTNIIIRDTGIELDN